MRLTHADRAVDPSTSATKGDVAAYYEAVAGQLLPELKGRPVALLRAPHGVGEETFFQKHPGKAPFSGVHVLDAGLWPGHGPLLEIRSLDGLMGAVQMNTIEFHTWNARMPRLNKPDRIVFDLDPGEGIAWADITRGAELVRDALLDLRLRCALKTSGGRGLHLVVPIAARWPVDVVRAFAEATVQQLADAHPDRFVARSGAAQRVGLIFIDWLRNGDGATTVAAWSLRARPGLGVSVPLAWDELPMLNGAAAWTLANAKERADQGDAWPALAPQSLTAALQAVNASA
ncbi:non-homologous end-joining DNA ligase [Pelomonas cellulosilytica]|uniref:Non-homologous end-joining DNA ligase n=1 Tax=Pelomonas cellulosilytica TaxID=2906762 RepID=A0ABS8XJV3_9BURK|nr:non-homologous end-joining DNA ligase [Pelomonas sp. P8]MCE4553127.1 non-homologous end-joining DNA ligase [Pelomonas sp. P8]